MSNAIHSEIISLELEIKAFKDGALKASSMLADLQAAVANIGKPIKPIFDSTAINNLDAAIRKSREWNTEIARQNQLLRDREHITAKNDADTNRVITGVWNQLQGYGGKKEFGDFLGKQEAARSRTDQLARSEQLTLKILQHEQGVAKAMAIQAADRQKAIADAQKLAAIAATKSTMGYGVGSVLANARSSSLLAGAGTAAFAMGGSGLGSALFMAERLSYNLKLGQVSLGEFAQKLGLVKLDGDGAEASMARFGSTAMKVGGALAVVAAGVGTMLAGNKLDVAMANMSTLLADATVKGAQFTAMMDDARDAASRLSSAYGTDMVEIVDGFKAALSAGIDASELEQFGNAAMTLAKGMGANFSQATNILTTFKDAYNGTVNDLVEYNDVLFNAINVGKIDVDQLNSNIGRLAVTAAEAGVSVKDMMAAVATLTRIGMTASQAITSLNQMIVSITNPTDKAAGYFEKLGIAYGGAALKGRALNAVVSDIKAKVGENPDLYGKLFTEERGRRAVIGMAANPALAAENRAEIEKTGTAAVAAARAMDTFGQNLYKLWTTVWNQVQIVGEELLTIANELFFPGGGLSASTIDGVGGSVRLLANVFKALATTVMQVAAIAMNVFIIPVVKGLMAIANLFRGELQTAGEGVRDMFTTAAATGATVAKQWERGFTIATATTKDFAKATTAAGDAIKEVYGDGSAMFDGMDKALTGIHKKATSVYDKLLDIANVQLTKERREKAVKDIATEYPMEQVESTREQLAYAAAAERAQIAYFNARKRINYAKAGEFSDKWERRRAYTDAAAAQQEIDALADGTSPLARDIAAAKKAMDEANIKHKEGVLATRERMLRVTMGERVTQREGDSANAITVMASVQKDLAERGIARGDVKNVKDIGAGGRYQSQLMAERRLLESHYAWIKANDEITEETRTASMQRIQDQIFLNTEAEQALAKQLAEQQKTNDKQQIDAVKSQHDEEEKLKKAQDARYKAEYDNANGIYDAKMRFYDREENRIEKLVGALRDASKSVQDTMDAATRKGQDPGRARRSASDALDAAVLAARNSRTPEEAIAAKKAYDKAAEQLSSTAAESGYGDIRAGRDINEAGAEVKSRLDAIDARLVAEGGENNSLRAQANRRLEQEMINNPYFKAAIDASKAVVKDALMLASKSGLSINGDVSAAIDIANIQMDLDVKKLGGVIKDEVERQFQKLRIDKGNGNPVPGDDKVPPGGLSSNNIYSGSSLAFSLNALNEMQA